MRVLVVADGRFHRDRFLGDLEDLAHLVLGHFHTLGQLFRRGFAAHFLQHLPADAVELVDRFDHVHRNTDGARLIGDRTGDGLANPPGGIGGELVAAAIFELVHRLHQADVAFLDQVQELQPAIGVLLGDRNHQAQVGLDHLLFRATSLGLANRHLAVDFLDVIDVEPVLGLDFANPALGTDEIFAAAGDGRRITTLGADQLVEPDLAGEVIRQLAYEVAPRHAGLGHADGQHFAFDAANIEHRGAQLQGKVVRGLGHQLETHEVRGQRVERCFRGLVFAAVFFERGNRGFVQALELLELGLGFFRVRAVVGRRRAFVVVVAIGRLVLVDHGIAGVGVDEADQHIAQALVVGFDLAPQLEQTPGGGREVGQREHHLRQAFLDTLGDPDFALSVEQLDRAHFAHVHAHRIGRAAELRIQRGQRGRGFLRIVVIVFVDGVLVHQQAVIFRCGFMHRDAHVADHVDDIFDLLGIDDIVRQRIVDLGIGQIAFLLAVGNQ